MTEQNSSISNFRRFLLRILLPLILAVSVAGGIFNYFFEKKAILSNTLCGAYKVNRILTETHPDEIPIFGSSRAEGSFIPDSLGPHYFNYGLSGAKYDVTLFFLEQECRKNKTSHVILLDFDLDGITYGLGDIANYIPNSNYAEVQRLLGKDNKLYYRIPFIKYFGRFETYLKDLLNNKIQLSKFSNKGAAIEMSALTPGQFDKLVTERKNTTTVFAKDSALTAKLLNIITAYTTRTFIFVIPPYHSSFFEKYNSEAASGSFLNMLRPYKNVKVFDFSKLALADDMFFNTSHLNLKGAIVFNRLLRDSLAGVTEK